MKLKDEKILKGRLAKSLEDMHSFYDHGPNVENSSIIKKSCNLAFNLSHFWHKTISNAMHQELAGNYDLQNFQEGMRFTLITASNYQDPMFLLFLHLSKINADNFKIGNVLES
ncbi:hypothetical protein SELMODRAFT_411418 [Selaginella moellendorffii]|uniref:Uncharacterized protein n=1 Tax=Selaginella moellendorffii TaxID=88036 RepID=D8RHV3_SELML|nr:hypothetical protein SELMODRAFT_411418 [Selaginella moellendorffii]